MTTMKGRSPRVRGRPPPHLWPNLIPRTIPACAGKTAGGRCHIRIHEDDPRVCGEDAVNTGRADRRKGRSPRVRGRPPPSTSVRAGPGTIPACAGKTEAGEIPTAKARDDPRVCGEDAPKTDYLVLGLGRSPRVRGRLSHLGTEADLDGTIPACAGKTVLIEVSPCALKDDPRVCGEDGSETRVQQDYPGRSPRVRGRRQLGEHGRQWVRTIPACAGKTDR